MFNLTLDPTPTYWWEVEMLIAGADGSIVVHPIQVQYRRLTEDELDALHAEVADQRLSDRVMSRRVMTGWRGVGADGVELPWSDENRDKLLSVAGAATAVVGGFYVSRSQVALGNLMRSRADGPAPIASTKSALANSAKH